MTLPPPGAARGLLCALRAVVKTYDAVRALGGVDFDVRAGEIHALVGENGAGKSTLLRVLGGATRPDAGTLQIDGRDVRFGAPFEAEAAGIAIVHQESRLVPGLTVAENIALGREPVLPGWRWPRLLDRRAARDTAQRALALLGETGIDPATKVADLGVARRQLVEIARGLSRAARLCALDEPTAALTGPETAALFAALRRLRGGGIGIVFISHRLAEVFALADRVTVLRDGRVAHHGPAAALDRAALIRAMVGRDIAQEIPWNPRPRGPEVLRIEGLHAAGVHGVDLVLHAGEVLGLAGLVGAGRSELAHALFGAAPRAGGLRGGRPRHGGRVLLDGREVAPDSPREAIDLGFALLTEDRNRLGLVASMNVRENMTLATLGAFTRGGVVRRAAERRAACAKADALALRPRDVEVPVTSLSGGNRQKVILARGLLSEARVLLFDEPTAGVDVGAKAEIYALIGRLAAQGAAVLVISSDLPELLGLCDRIAVMSAGRIAATLARGEATEDRVMELAIPAGRTS